MTPAGQLLQLVTNNAEMERMTRPMTWEERVHNMKTINYYGTRDNYIHLKFGDCRKAYNFTKKFIKEHSDFAKQYQSYFENGSGYRSGSFDGFSSPFAVVAYAFKKSIPVHFYYNFTDTPATDYNEIIAYLVKENTFVK